MDGKEVDEFDIVAIKHHFVQVYSKVFAWRVNLTFDVIYVDFVFSSLLVGKVRSDNFKPNRFKKL